MANSSSVFYSPGGHCKCISLLSFFAFLREEASWGAPILSPPPPSSLRCRLPSQAQQPGRLEEGQHDGCGAPLVIQPEGHGQQVPGNGG